MSKEKIPKPKNLIPEGAVDDKENPQYFAVKEYTTGSGEKKEMKFCKSCGSIAFTNKCSTCGAGPEADKEN